MFCTCRVYPWMICINIMPNKWEERLISLVKIILSLPCCCKTLCSYVDQLPLRRRRHEPSFLAIKSQLFRLIYALQFQQDGYSSANPEPSNQHLREHLLLEFTKTTQLGSGTIQLRNYTNDIESSASILRRICLWVIQESSEIVRSVRKAYPESLRGRLKSSAKYSFAKTASVCSEIRCNHSAKDGGGTR